VDGGARTVVNQRDFKGLGPGCAPPGVVWVADDSGGEGHRRPGRESDSLGGHQDSLGIRLVLDGGLRVPFLRGGEKRIKHLKLRGGIDPADRDGVDVVRPLPRHRGILDLLDCLLKGQRPVCQLGG